MHPSVHALRLVCAWQRLYLAILFRHEFIDLSLALFVEFVGASGDECCRVRDSRDLSTQQVLFFAEEERVADDVTLQVTREQDLDLSSRLDVRWSQVWQALPGAEWVVSHEVSVLVDSCALLLLISFLFFRGWLLTAFIFGFFSTLGSSLDHIVVRLCAPNFTEETHVRCLLLTSQLLKRLLEKVAFLLTEADSSTTKSSFIS